MGGMRQQQVVDVGGWEHVDGTARPRARPAARRGDAGSDATETRLAQLARTIEAEIIPRLVLAHRHPPDHRTVRGGGDLSPGEEEQAEFTRLVLTQDVDALLAAVDAMRARGMALDTVYLQLFAPTARHLGRLWDEDLCDFTEVTVGLWRLQQLMREFSPAFRNECDRDQSAHRCLLAPMPGEQHTFGLYMVAEFFRRAGWDVCDFPPTSVSDLVSLVRREAFAFAGLSLSCESRLDAMAACIAEIRRASRNRAIGVMVGGTVFLDHPEWVARVGADMTACDGREAVRLAEKMFVQATAGC